MASTGAIYSSALRQASAVVRRKPVTRGFHSSRRRCAAQNFVMPAMSPTMTEGNIASWKVKEGDSFSAGDVLLEIETDKAQMDVEAQEDGKVAKITQQDGTKAVKVGVRIAVLADPGDDLQTLQIPQEDTAPASSDKPSEAPSKAKSSDTSSSAQGSSSSSSSSSDPEQPPADRHSTTSGSKSSGSRKYPLYPAVQHLLHEKGISESEAGNIRVTGPGGRLLKGDVLAHLGRIDKSYAATSAERLTKLSHLDLSNIKISTPKASTSVPSADAAKKAEAKTPEKEVESQVAVPISLAAVLATQKRIQESLGLTLPLTTFIARASEIANENLPHSSGAAASADELFNAVLGLDKISGKARQRNGSRGSFTPFITALPPRGAVSEKPLSRKSSSDIIDVLTGTVKKHTGSVMIAGAAGVASGTNNVFSVSVKKGDEKRARVYLERVKTVLEAEPGRCVL